MPPSFGEPLAVWQLLPPLPQGGGKDAPTIRGLPKWPATPGPIRKKAPAAKHGPSDIPPTGYPKSLPGILFRFAVRHRSIRRPPWHEPCFEGETEAAGARTHIGGAWK